ncbi:MAG TPA: lipoprotein-releasing ABC transporter permease subunit [Steroidobacteraceae bacterium]|nr:lipoprotein-releasing ABC transporter permease subunit [Steroidobacteraceae bacterium]
MFHPLSLYIGLRYVRARSHKFFVSFITWASLIGVGVGVAALIVILSVMNGFEDELRDRLLSLSAHARVTASGQVSAADWQSASKLVRGVPGVAGVAPYAEVQALALRTPEMLPVILRGIDPAVEPQVTEIAQSIKQGTLSDLIPGSDRVLVGAVIADRLGLARGDEITLLIPTVTADGAPAPKLRQLQVAGIFEVGLQDHDGVLVFAHIDDVKALVPGQQNGVGLRIRFNDVLAAPGLSAKLRTLLPKPFEVTDWTQDNASYFRATRIERTMMSLILFLIVAVAAFNIVAMLVMVVTDKRTDIAILRTFGASPRRVMGVFITQGLVIGWLGVAVGLALGLSIALNVATIEPFLEHTFGFQIFDPDVYYITAIPSDVRWENVVIIGFAAFLLTGVATLYPAIRASRTPPADALRYE